MDEHWCCDEKETIVSILNKQNKRNEISIIDGYSEISYEELMEKADLIANELLFHGVDKGALIGVCMKRSWMLVATLIGILRAGCAYVPLDPSYPNERIEYMLKHAGVSAVFVESEVEAKLCHTVEQVIWVNKIQRKKQDSIRFPSASDLAYVIYTSGSTGKPKGVAVEHKNVVAMSLALRCLYTTEELKGVLAAASVCFDTSVMEILGTLMLGGTIILAKNALELPNLPYACKVKACVMVPSSMKSLLSSSSLPDSLRCIVLGGEEVKSSLVEQLYRQNAKLRVLNAYGPTEDTVFSTIGEIRPHTKIVTIGCSVINSRSYILDEKLKRIDKKGVPGELYLAGGKLARGYLYETELTKERFIDIKPSSNIPEERLYRTGDLVQWTEGNEIEFLGRVDLQVKIRGFRVEIGEIEAALESMPAIATAAVAVKNTNNEQKILVAYIVKQDRCVLDEDIKTYLNKKLPKHMVPKLLMHMDSLVYLPNGKLDRNNLPSLREVQLAISSQESLMLVDNASAKNTYAAILEKIQIEIASLFGFSDIKQINGNLMFERLGLDSLSSLELSSRLTKVLHCSLSPQVFLDYESPVSLAKYVTSLSSPSVQVRESSMETVNFPDTLASFQTLLQSSHPTFQCANVISWSVADKSVLVHEVTVMVNDACRNPYGKVLRTGSSATGIIGDSYNKDIDRMSIIWSTNLYFGLNRDPRVISEASHALCQYGTGMGISAAATGMTNQHLDFERDFAELVGKPSACLFPTGYTANLGGISGIIGTNDVVVIDQLCHASIVDGARLSGATIRTFQHNNVEDLEAVLKSEISIYKTVLVVLESVYSMGEGLAPVRDIVSSAKKYGALVLVDEAHSFGFYGAKGAGVCAELGVTKDVDFIMTTLSKALGSIGGVIAASQEHIDLLKSSSRAYIFQASISPADIGAALASLRILQADESLREQLWDRTRYMRKRFEDAGFDLGTGDGPIVTPHFADKDKLYAIVHSLYQKGVQTLAVTYPIVEMGGGRLRFICSAAHSHADIDKTVEALIEAEIEVNKLYAVAEKSNSINEKESEYIVKLLSGWRESFFNYLKSMLAEDSVLTPELVLSLKFDFCNELISLEVTNDGVVITNSPKLNLSECIINLKTMEAISALCSYDVRAILNCIIEGTIELNGQTEPFVWFIARFVECRDNNMVAI
ncbi:amino acid adenylation domain-containing protein [Shewanella waksmanii]|uniref:amino acid adenylation domain-containing protein n=1 Tax=Shewanella waksmanii TaxID=213783 RepID=UPI0004B56666|nr:amino acid adenylation domain-containing protein [Shewanella waksmanii]